MSTDEFKLVRQDLGHYQVEPTPSQDELRSYYSDRYYQQPARAGYAVEYSDTELAWRRLKADQWIHAIEQATEGTTLAAGRTLLDVGCGEGFLLRAATDAGWDASGMDFSSEGIGRWHPDLADRVSAGNAFDLLDATIESGRKFGVCTLQNVLEHVPDPSGMLERLKAVVGAGGVLLVQVPNDFSALQLRARTLGLVSSDFWVAVPDHLNYFDYDSGKRFAEAHDYELVDAFADFPIDWFLFHQGSNYISRDRAAGRMAHEARMELDTLLSARGLDQYLQFYRTLAACGQGRNLCFILRPRQSS